MDKREKQLGLDGRSQAIQFEDSRYYSNITVMRTGSENIDTLTDLSVADLEELVRLSQVRLAELKSRG
jgi:hypothetical protein